MFKVIVIFVVILAVLIGGMLTLRTTRNSGMPNEDVLKRAAERAREQAAKDKADR
ncbi:MAG TPA: DUF2897 family protein [Steroidobacteraceae bacterium]